MMPDLKLYDASSLYYDPKSNRSPHVEDYLGHRDI